MPRPCKSRTLEGIPNPVLYIPSGWTHEQTAPAQLAIEDFEVLRLVDGHVHTIEEAAEKVGVSRSTAGRMLERARRVLALGLERRAPIHIDASEGSAIAPPICEPVTDASDAGVLAVAVGDSNLNGQVARAFGRAASFALISADGQLRFVDNPGATVQRDAAASAVNLLQSNGVSRVVAGRFGAEALEALGIAQIEPSLMVGVKLRQAIEFFNVIIK